MKTLFKILPLIAQSLVPILTYEVGTISFWIMTWGMMSLSECHQIAWSQDLAYALIFFTILYLFALIWITFIDKPLKQTSHEKDFIPQHDVDPDILMQERRGEGTNNNRSITESSRDE